jgi:hypothetical protein
MQLNEIEKKVKSAIRKPKILPEKESCELQQELCSLKINGRQQLVK